MYIIFIYSWRCIFHRAFKTVIMSLLLFRFCASLETRQASAAGTAYGDPLRLQGEFFDDHLNISQNTQLVFLQLQKKR